MLMVSNVADERLTTAHRAKLAYIYVRQSSVHQVRQHQESTEMQYRLVDRAVRLGWPHERVQVIDEDLGKSGAGGVERQGFQKLIAEIGLGNAGLVISFDASRLARNNRDWHQLLELCSVFGVLIADGERLYDPRAYHDRLLLGLSGIMLQRNLLYTGVTRGKRLVVLVGQKKAVAIAVRNLSGRRRWSKLREWLQGETAD
jgi:hypothetical protein